MPLIVWMTPVGIGKIEADPQARLAHAGNPRFEQVALDPAIVNHVDSAGGLGVPQRHAIVVLGGDDGVFGTGLLEDFRPLGRIKIGHLPAGQLREISLRIDPARNPRVVDGVGYGRGVDRRDKQETGGASLHPETGGLHADFRGVEFGWIEPRVDHRHNGARVLQMPLGQRVQLADFIRHGGGEVFLLTDIDLEVVELAVVRHVGAESA